jgi:hypothetical protein
MCAAAKRRKTLGPLGMQAMPWVRPHPSGKASWSPGTVPITRLMADSDRTLRGARWHSVSVQESQAA